MMTVRRRAGNTDTIDQLALKRFVTPEELARIHRRLRGLAKRSGDQSRNEFLSAVRRYLDQAPDDDVRIVVIESLARARLESAAARRLMLRGLSDRSWLVRVEALESAADHEARFAIPAVRRLLQDRRKLVRGYAADALAHLAGTGSERWLRQRLAIERQPWVRARIHGALLFLGDEASLPPLRRLAEHRDHLTQAISVRLLGDYTPKSHAEGVLALLRALLNKQPPVGVSEVIATSVAELSRRKSARKRQV